jgi:hypothetical protein
MPPNLKPSEPLSQVVFIHDYLQLWFQDERFNVYNLAEIEHGGAKLAQGQLGYCDSLVALIGQRVVGVSKSDSHMLVLSFEGGARFSVRGDAEAIHGPEAFEFNGEGQYLVVEPNP